jgi:hypothetical protein
MSLECQRRFRTEPKAEVAMSKIIALVIIAMMAIQIIKPIGLPGFRQRRDFWKLAVVAFAAFALDVFLTHVT